MIISPAFAQAAGGGGAGSLRELGKRQTIL